MAVYLDCWCVGLCYLHFASENPEDGKQRYDFWVSPPGCPHMPVQTEGGEPSRNSAQLCARMQGCVNDDLRTDGLQKGWGFWIGTWNVDLLTGRAGEVVQALS